MQLEEWKSNKGNIELHHFLDKDDPAFRGRGEIYVFGMNAQLLGETFYLNIKKQIEDRLSVLEHSPWSFAKQ